MLSLNKSTTFAVFLVFTLFHDAGAFTQLAGNSRPMTALPANNNNNNNNKYNMMEVTTTTTTNRRNALLGIVSIVGAAALVGNPQEASARYSSYAHREQDWQERQSKGEITYKTAKDLRAELKEIVPQNAASSKIFCPNGPSAAVSPLMENKCGDRLAIPSVYGRTQDVVGNSIPGTLHQKMM